MEATMENFEDEIGRNFLAFQRTRAQKTQWLNEARNGNWFARLIANQPNVVRHFPDHALVAQKLLASEQIDTLASVVSSGRLHGPSLRFYRMALGSWLAQR